ncbi:hypothetical protein BH23ACT1_BH23ACT1_14030 [soil metagenome]
MRIVDRVVSAVLGLALLVGGLLVAIEIVLAGLNRPPWLMAHDRWTASARTTPWSDADLRLIFVGLIVVGVLLLVVEGARRRPEVLPLAAQGQGVVTALDRRQVERWLGERVEGVEGVMGAGVRIGTGSVLVEATSVGRDTATVEVGVRQVAASSLESLNLDRPTRLRVKVRPNQEVR